MLFTSSSAVPKTVILRFIGTIYPIHSLHLWRWHYYPRRNYMAGPAAYSRWQLTLYCQLSNHSMILQRINLPFKQVKIKASYICELKHN